METKTRVLIADSSDDYRNLMALFLRVRTTWSW